MDNEMKALFERIFTEFEELKTRMGNTENHLNMIELKQKQTTNILEESWHTTQLSDLTTQKDIHQLINLCESIELLLKHTN